MNRHQLLEVRGRLLNIEPRGPGVVQQLAMIDDALKRVQEPPPQSRKRSVSAVTIDEDEDEDDDDDDLIVSDVKEVETPSAYPPASTNGNSAQSSGASTPAVTGAMGPSPSLFGGPPRLPSAMASGSQPRKLFRPAQKRREYTSLFSSNSSIRSNSSAATPQSSTTDVSQPTGGDDDEIKEISNAEFDKIKTVNGQRRGQSAYADTTLQMLQYARYRPHEYSKLALACVESIKAQMDRLDREQRIAERAYSFAHLSIKSMKNHPDAHDINTRMGMDYRNRRIEAKVRLEEVNKISEYYSELNNLLTQVARKQVGNFEQFAYTVKLAIKTQNEDLGLLRNKVSESVVQNLHMSFAQRSTESLFGRSSSTPNLTSSERLSFGGAGSQADELSNLLAASCDWELPPDQRVGTPEEMKSTLLEHQRIGLTWMKEKEDTKKGGILADDMGLGKTIQTIALMVSNKSTNPACKTTLIVAPVALLNQWAMEIEKHVKPEHKLKVYVHHRELSPRMHTRWEQLQRYDVVITTYNLVARDYKENTKLAIEDCELPPEQQVKDSILFKGKWYRVVLDEAQYIKNKLTQSAKACCALESQYRWCLSGTPIQNKVEEYYSLIKFLRIPPYNDEKKFNREIGTGIKSSDSGSMQKLRVLIGATLLRRTKKSHVDGKPILQLPERIVEADNSEFNEEQRARYTALESSTQGRVRSFLNDNQLGNHYSSVLVMLLRLRQACCHPALIDLAEHNRKKNSLLRDGSSTQALELVRKFNPSVVGRTTDLYHRVYAHDASEDQDDGFQCPICYDAVDASSIVLVYPCGHAMCEDCIPEYFNKYALQGNSALCCECRQPIMQDRWIDFELFRLVYIKRLSDFEINKRRRDEKSAVRKKEQERRLISKRMRQLRQDRISNAELFKGLDFDDEEENEDSVMEGQDEAASLELQSKEASEASRKLIVKQFGLEDVFPNGWESSAKIDRCMEIVDKTLEEYPGQKIIIFSQFTTFLDLVGIPMALKGYDYLRYDGSMSTQERNETIRQFMEEPTQQIMLVSLKAGNVGLTLTAANHVIIMDPFWNPYVEEQAIDRAHRIGQRNDVRVHKLYITASVEDRILELQDQKRQMIDSALDEGELRNVGRLDRRQLLYLFGMGDNPPN
ncbi:hypothetical protein TRVA0_045S00496 [Trichomonascus vanleenenianus]|uniref:uncharacterized protein n=1 Tax=Trichomonascus vanleenenianus TaxID=2268995 RepID=UPI003ECB2A91